MAALGKVIVAVAGVWPGVLTGRVVDRVGKGIRNAPRDALLVYGIDKASRGRVFGFHRAMDTLGAPALPRRAVLWDGRHSSVIASDAPKSPSR